jgi:hypothetical protein
MIPSLFFKKLTRRTVVVETENGLPSLLSLELLYWCCVTPSVAAVGFYHVRDAGRAVVFVFNYCVLTYSRLYVCMKLPLCLYVVGVGS